MSDKKRTLWVKAGNLIIDRNGTTIATVATAYVNNAIADLLVAAPETAAERDRLKVLVETLVEGLKKMQDISRDAQGEYAPLTTTYAPIEYHPYKEIDDILADLRTEAEAQ